MEQRRPSSLYSLIRPLDNHGGRPDRAAPACVAWGVGTTVCDGGVVPIGYIARIRAESAHAGISSQVRWRAVALHCPGGPQHKLRGEPDMRRSDLVRHATKGKAV